MTTDESSAVTPEDSAREFERARKRRNVMLAWSLVGFMVLVFSITALRFVQNMEARSDANAVQEVSDEVPASE